MAIKFKSKRLDTLLNLFNHRCAWCHTSISSAKSYPDAKADNSFIFQIVDNRIIRIKRATIDHLIPRSKGGGNNLDNLVPSCYGCNSKRKNEYSVVMRATLVVNAILA